MYIVTAMFRDNQDNGYLYNIGDTFPRKGYSPNAERIEQLSSANNVRKMAVIAKVAEKSRNKSKAK